MVNVRKLKEISEDFSVLFIEDDIDLCRTTTPIYERFFKRVDIAYNGQEGLEAYNQYKEETNTYYDIVISDIQMPKMNGIELSKKILKILPEQKIIITSAYNDQEYLIELINVGVSGFFQKPIKNEEMFSVLHSVCSSLIGNSCITLTDGYAFDASKKLLLHNEDIVELSMQEQKLLDMLSKNVNHFFSAVDIFNHIYYDQVEKEFSNDSIKSLIKRLRKKVPENLIANTPNLGYSLKITS